MRAGIESSVKVKAAFHSRLDTASNASGILNAVVSTNFLFACQHGAYCSLRNEMERNEMERNEMKICSLRNENL